MMHASMYWLWTALHLGTVIWVFLDAAGRGTPRPWLYALMALVLPWPLGPVAWLVTRPYLGRA